MGQFDYTIKGAESLQRAIERSPGKVKEELGKFFVRGVAEYRKTVERSPWRVGSDSGGVPVMTGHLKDSHGSNIKAFEASYGPEKRYSVNYSKHVHKKRPWLDHAYNENKTRIESLARDMLKIIVGDLAK